MGAGDISFRKGEELNSAEMRAPRLALLDGTVLVYDIWARCAIGNVKGRKWGE